MSTVTTHYTLRLTEEERGELLQLLEQATRDLHEEARRTENPSYQEQVHQQEARIRALIDKVRQPTLWAVC